MLNGNTSLNEVHPPTWAHPLPSSLIVHQDILAIYNTLGPNIDPLTTCTTPNVQNYLSKTYISFSKRVVRFLKMFKVEISVFLCFDTTFTILVVIIVILLFDSSFFL